MPIHHKKTDSAPSNSLMHRLSFSVEKSYKPLDGMPRRIWSFAPFTMRTVIALTISMILFLFFITSSQKKHLYKIIEAVPFSGYQESEPSVSHAFLVSVYYYPKSKSLGENAVAFNMAIDQKTISLKNLTFNVVGSNMTTRETSVALTQTEGGPVPLCQYTVLAAFTNTVANLDKLEIEMGGTSVSVPFKHARVTAPEPVIICISPQFVAEQWQMFIMHVHAAHRFGGHMHLYLTSAVMPYYDMMKEYEAQGYLTLDYWLRMKFPHSDTAYLDPNANVEWRNQAGAQTDCLLQYKEAAEYIAFFDMDDILFPKNYPTYIEEFQNEFLKKPDASAIFYGRREHEFLKDEYLNDFNFHELFASLKSSPTVKRGKVVVKPTAYNSTWIHYSMNVPWSLRINVTSPALVHVQRPVQKHGGNNYTKLWKFDFGKLIEKINLEDIDHFQQDLERIRNISAVSSLAPHLPSSNFYLPIVFKCYFDAFYGPAFVTKTGVKHCPNADFCELPQREDYPCMHSDAEYHSGPHMEPVTFHWTTNSFWSRNIGCYQ